MTSLIQLPSDNLSFRDLSLNAIRRWRLIFIGSIGLLGLSLLSWLFIPSQEEPRIEVPGMTVVMVYPGASPEDIELQVVKPIEEILYELTDIEWLEARAVQNQATFDMRFASHVNMDVMVEKARGKIMSKKTDLPPEVKDPIVVHWTTGRVPQMVLAVTGMASDRLLSDEARRLKSDLISLPGVAGVDLRGEHKTAIRIRLDPVKLAHHQVSADEVVRQLRLSNVRIPGGTFDVGPLNVLLQIKHEVSSASDVAKIPLSAIADRNGARRTLSLGDVAEVRDASLTEAERFAYDGQPAVGLCIRFRGGEDAVKVGDTVKKHLEIFKPTMPQNTRIAICQDQPAWIRTSVMGFIHSLLEGMLLVMMIITLGMGWRAALVVSGVIPLAVGGTVLGLFILGFSLDNITIGGMIVALGLLVDDAVVVTESVQIMRDKGLTALRAAVFGTARVFWANNGTTAVAVASFLPLFAMGGDIGVYIIGMPLAVVFALGTSLLVAQLFTPWISTFLIKKPAAAPDIPDTDSYNRQEDRSTGHAMERNPVLVFLRNLYTGIIPWVARHPKKVVLLFILLLAAALSLFKIIGVQFFPKADKGVLFVTLELPRGARLEFVSEKYLSATAIIKKDPAVIDTSAVIGGSYPVIFGSRDKRNQENNIADILVRLKPHTDSTQTAIRLRQAMADLVGVKVAVDELSYGPPVPHPIFIRIMGSEHQKLRSIAEEVKAKLGQFPGVINISDSLSESLPMASVHLDADKALRYGVTPAQVGQTLRWLYSEDKVTEFRVNQDLVEVVLDRAPEPSRPFEALNETPIPTAINSVVPLKEAGQAELTHGFAQLSRRNTQRVVEVWADVSGYTLSSDVMAVIDPWLRGRNWEAGYGFSYGGEAEETSKSFQKLGIAAIGALILVFLLLLLMFDNLLLSFLVILAVPFALIGALPGLALTGNAFGFMAFLGLIALIGVYVNHKIYFVDRMLELLRRGETLADAILHAGQDRLRPVVLTALTAVLGLLPLTLTGSSMWSSFGWVNIFGLITSIPLSLILLPALIMVFFRPKTG